MDKHYYDQKAIDELYELGRKHEAMNHVNWFLIGAAAGVMGYLLVLGLLRNL